MTKTADSAVSVIKGLMVGRTLDGTIFIAAFLVKRVVDDRIGDPGDHRKRRDLRQAGLMIMLFFHYHDITMIVVLMPVIMAMLMVLMLMVLMFMMAMLMVMIAMMMPLRLNRCRQYHEGTGEKTRYECFHHVIF